MPGTVFHRAADCGKSRLGGQSEWCISTRVFLAFACGTIAAFGGCGPSDPSSQHVRVAAQVPVYDGPSIPDYSIWRPFFLTDLGDHSTSEIVGTGFVVSLSDEDQPLMVTALHLIGPAGGLAEAIGPTAIREAINQVVVTDAFGATDSAYEADLPIDLDSVADDDSKVRVVDELILFPAGKAARLVRPLRFSEKPAAVGDTVWLTTAVFGGAPPSQTAHRAVVTEQDDEGHFGYRFENERLSLEAADGAPLLNDDGLVVGVHLHDSSKDGTIAGRGLVAAPVKEAMERLRGRE